MTHAKLTNRAADLAFFILFTALILLEVQASIAPGSCATVCVLLADTGALGPIRDIITLANPTLVTDEATLPHGPGIRRVTAACLTVPGLTDPSTPGQATRPISLLGHAGVPLEVYPFVAVLATAALRVSVTDAGTLGPIRDVVTFANLALVTDEATLPHGPGIRGVTAACLAVPGLTDPSTPGQATRPISLLGHAGVPLEV